MVREIDLMHLGNDRVIAAHEVRGVIVDPGPSTGLERLIGALNGEPPRALLLTHIHLDHAGASGSLVRRFPGLRVYVHEVGAPHLADPSTLVRSAGRLYGDEMERLWGEVLPVPSENLVALRGGEEVEGFRVEHTPGHAGHLIFYLDPADGEGFAGDTAGVRIPPGDYTIAPTPPPEVDVEAWLASIDRIEDLGPRRLRLTHFGAADDVGAQLDRLRESLRRQAERARPGDRDTFLAALNAEIERGTNGDRGVRSRLAVPPEQTWLGLERYWRKRRGG
jgi:glyoxylase-like metal-dependent hydrolase (beta-lactamase superfamily II)